MIQNRKVDLCTNSSFLEEKLLEEYPHNKFFPDKEYPHNKFLSDEEHDIIEAEKNTLLRFLFDLDERDLISYLEYIESELSPEVCYDVKVSRGREYIRVRREGRVITDPNEIQELLRKKLLLH